MRVKIKLIIYFNAQHFDRVRNRESPVIPRKQALRKRNQKLSTTHVSGLRTRPDLWTNTLVGIKVKYMLIFNTVFFHCIYVNKNSLMWIGHMLKKD